MIRRGRRTSWDSPPSPPLDPLRRNEQGSRFPVGNAFHSGVLAGSVGRLKEWDGATEGIEGATEGTEGAADGVEEEATGACSITKGREATAGITGFGRMG